MWTLCIGVVAALSLSLAMPTRVSAETIASAQGGDVASLRLLSAGGPVEGVYDVGIAIEMTSGSHTYWKQPGEAGVPPVFAFNGSENLAKAEVLFPVPTRIDEEGIVAFGYRDSVVFPVKISPVDAHKPVVLKVDVTYAVCNRICMPAHDSGTVTLVPTAPATSEAVIKEALARVPKPLAETAARGVEIVPDASSNKPGWTVKLSGAFLASDIFVTAPQGYYFATKPLGGGAFSLVCTDRPTADGAARVPVTFTLAQGQGGLTVTRDLNLPPPTTR